MDTARSNPLGLGLVRFTINAWRHTDCSRIGKDEAVVWMVVVSWYFTAFSLQTDWIHGPVICFSLLWVLLQLFLFFSMLLMKFTLWGGGRAVQKKHHCFAFRCHPSHKPFEQLRNKQEEARMNGWIVLFDSLSYQFAEFDAKFLEQEALTWKL